jgi:uncharacterized protein with GYD domain
VVARTVAARENHDSAGAAWHLETDNLQELAPRGIAVGRLCFTFLHIGGSSMATFIATINFTEQGIQNFQESPKRAAAFKSVAKKLGVKVTDVYWTLGRFDGVLIMEAASEEAVTAAMLQLSSLGNVKTTTARAFNSGEFEKVIGSLGKK